MSDSAVWWAHHSGIDGSVTMRQSTSRRVLAQAHLKLKDAQRTRASGCSKLETYGSPDLIGSYLSSGMLDAQFDFNVYDKAVGAIAFEEGSWSTSSKRASPACLRTAHTTSGNITGNQDRPRFTSLADGTLDVNEDMKFQGWTRDIQHGGDEGYAKMRTLMSFIMSVPGIPCVYYGDEIADVGGNDPDNRRMMRFGELNDQETETRAWTASWAKFRRSRMSMLYGTTRFDVLNDAVLHIQRSYLGEVTDIYLNRESSPAPLPELGTGQPVPVLAGSLTSDGQLPAWSAVAFGQP